MIQVVTPEEMAALLEGLREAEGGPGSLPCDAPEEIMAKDQVFSGSGRLTIMQNFCLWLMALADLWWPNL
jgi:hypothetical protein